MNLKQLFEIFLSAGIEADPRPKEEIKKSLMEKKKAYGSSKDPAVLMASDQCWDNPYGDSRILYGVDTAEIKKILVGIDIDGSEILLADRWRERGQGIDAIVAHHPEGRAQVQLYQVIGIQEELLKAKGVPEVFSQAIVEERELEVQRNLLPLNHQKTVDLARLLDIPFLCVHSPADNLAQKFINDYLLFQGNLDEKRDKVCKIVELLLKIPEFKMAAANGIVPQIISGKKSGRCGRLYIKMNGGTSGPEKSIEALADAGIGTIVCMHLPETQRKKAKECHMNVVIAGHMACDSLGMNLLIDEAYIRGIEIVACGGLLRHCRH